MSGQHTQGRLAVHVTPLLSEIWLRREDCDGVLAQPKAIVGNDADARRLVACWNACDGGSTEDLEALAFFGIPVTKVVDGIKQERDTARAELATARTLLAEINASIPNDHFDPLVDRIRALLGPAGGPLAIGTVSDMAARLVDYAAAVGVVVTVAETVVDVRPAPVRA